MIHLFMLNSKGEVMKLDNIVKAYTENTGGGCLVDFLELENGLLLAVSDEAVCLYANMDDFYEGKALEGFWIPRDRIVKDWEKIANITQRSWLWTKHNLLKNCIKNTKKTFLTAF